VRVLEITMALSGVALVAQALAPTFETLLIARALQGAFQAAIAPMIIALIAASTPESLRASVLNLTQFPFYLAVMGGGALGGVLAAQNIRAVFVAAAGGMALAVGMLARLRASGRLPKPCMDRRLRGPRRRPFSDVGERHLSCGGRPPPR